jgi:broad specificity phosphatase PhoE
VESDRDDPTSLTDRPSNGEQFLGDFEGHVYEPGKSHQSYSSAEAIEPFLERVLDWWDDLFPYDLDEMPSPLFRNQPSHDRIMQVLVVTHGGPIRRLVQSGLHQRRKFPFDPNAYLDPMFPPQSSHFTSLPPLRVGNCSITRILMDNQTSPRSEESSHSFEPMGMGMHRSSSQSLAERLVSLVPNLVGMRKGRRWHGVITAYADDQHIVRSSLRSSHDPTMTGDDYFTPQYSL